MRVYVLCVFQSIHNLWLSPIRLIYFALIRGSNLLRLFSCLYPFSFCMLQYAYKILTPNHLFVNNDGSSTNRQKKAAHTNTHIAYTHKHKQVHYWVLWFIVFRAISWFSLLLIALPPTPPRNVSVKRYHPRFKSMCLVLTFRSLPLSVSLFLFHLADSLSDWCCVETEWLLIGSIKFMIRKNDVNVWHWS